MLPGIAPAVNLTRLRAYFGEWKTAVPASAAHTFSSVALGAAAKNRKLVVALEAGAGATRTSTSITVGGVAMSRVIRASDSAQTNLAEIWELNTGGTAVESATVADVIVTTSATMSDGINIATWSLHNCGTLFDSDRNYSTGTGASPYSLSGVDFLEGGFVVAVGGAAGAVAFGVDLGLTKVTTGNWFFIAALHPTPAAAGQTMSMSWSSGSPAQRRLAFAAWRGF